MEAEDRDPKHFTLSHDKRDLHVQFSSARFTFLPRFAVFPSVLTRRSPGIETLHRNDPRLSKLLENHTSFSETSDSSQASFSRERNDRINKLVEMTGSKLSIFSC